MKFNTKAIHSGHILNDNAGAVVAPIYLTSTYDQNGRDNLEYFYSRGENPTRFALESILSALEGSRFGLTFSSGQAAGLAAVSLLEPGDRILSIDDVYGGTFNLFRLIESTSNVKTDFFDFTKLDQIEKIIRRRTRLFWIETPTNPLLKIVDIEKICDIAHKRNIKVLIDNTFCTSYIQRPLDLGADFVLYSTTKYYSGHSDVVGGALMLNDQGAYKRVKQYQAIGGAVPSPFDCWLISRGIKTLGIRLDKQNENAVEIADYLVKSSRVFRVIYPGIKEHPQFNIAKKQMKKPGGIISFYYKGDPSKLMKRLELFTTAVSLGGVNSLVECPAAMTHRPIPEKERVRYGITNSLLRLSVGIEDVDDLLDDLDKAL